MDDLSKRRWLLQRDDGSHGNTAWQRSPRDIIPQLPLQHVSVHEGAPDKGDVALEIPLVPLWPEISLASEDLAPALQANVEPGKKPADGCDSLHLVLPDDSMFFGGAESVRWPAPFSDRSARSDISQRIIKDLQARMLRLSDAEASEDEGLSDAEASEDESATAESSEAMQSEDDTVTMVSCEDGETRVSARGSFFDIATPRWPRDRETPRAAVASVACVEGNALSLGIAGGALGSAAGTVVGAIVGVGPAFVTLGLSIPIGAGLGSATGLCLGGVAGAACSKLGMSSLTFGFVGDGKFQPQGPLSKSLSQLNLVVRISEDEAGSKAGDSRTGSIRSAAVPAVAGAVVLGSVGGASGSAVGGLIGAGLGVVPAIFTFGLSIPISAALGSGVGLCLGTVTGSSVGLVSGAWMGSRNRKSPGV